MILSLSTIGYIDWRIGRLSYDLAEDFEQLDGQCLHIARSGTRSFSDQCIIFNISIDTDVIKLWLNWHISINGGRTWKLYCVIA